LSSQESNSQFEDLSIKMKAHCSLVLACAAEALGAAFPATTYGDKLRPLVSSKKIQNLITTDG
jgi:hypothetical protein